MDGSPWGLDQTRQLLETLAVRGGGGALSGGGRGWQAENGRDLLSVLLGLSGGDLVLMDSSCVPMPHPPDRRVLLWMLLCCAEQRHPFIATSPSRVGPTFTIGRFDQDLP